MSEMPESPASGPAQKVLPRGATVFREGEQSRDLWVLLKGSLRVSKGRRQVATIDEPGSYFGEMSSLLDVPRTATVTVVEDATLLMVPQEEIPSFFGTTPHLALKIARDLAARLAKTTQDLADHRQDREGKDSG